MADSTSVVFAPTEEQELIRSTSRQFLSERLGLPRVRELMMSDDGFERGTWKEMADLGWTGLGIPEEHGGAGLGPVEMGVLLEEMGRMVTPGPFFASAVLATAVITQCGTAEDHSRWLPRLASGEIMATVAVFEEPRAWDIASGACVAERSGDGWSITGRKRAVLDGHLADVILITTRAEDGVAVFAVDRESAGLTVRQEEVLDPTRRQATVDLSGVRVDTNARIGEGDVTIGLERSLRLATVALASEQTGGSQACLDMAVEYAKTRHQFGRPIGSFQTIKHRCATMLVMVEHARSTALYGAQVANDDTELALAAPLASSIASEAYVWVAGENIQVHGGIGFTWEHDAHLYLKRAKASSLLLGSPRVQRDRLGRALGI